MTRFNSCAHCREQLPWYIAGTCTTQERLLVEQHLATCVSCEQEAAQWGMVASAVQTERAANAPVPAIPYKASWVQFKERLASESVQVGSVSSWHARLWSACMQRCTCVWDMVRVQLRLLPLECWLLTALVPLLGLFLFFVHLPLARVFLLLATGSIVLSTLATSLLATPNAERGSEITLTTITSPRVTFALRLLIVGSAFTLVNVVTLIGFRLGQSTMPLDWLATNWFVPQCCLVAVALCCSALLHPIVAILLTQLLWGLRMASELHSLRNVVLLERYASLFHQPLLLFFTTLGALFLVFTFLERRRGFSWRA